MDKISYALGLSIANNFLTTGITKLNVDDFTSAVKAVLEGKETAISYEEAKAVINTFFTELQEEHQRINKEAGVAFLAENKKNSEVIETASGLQYQVITMGNGKRPSATDKVKCHYHGTLISGQVFDSSVERGEPAEFGLNQVIPGWTEALQLMPIGSKFRLFLPSHLAYGERGAGEMIAPNSTLIFDVELIDIV